MYLCHLYSPFPLFFLSLLLELKSTQSGRWIAYRQKTLVTRGFNVTYIWHNLPWAISLGMTNAICLWKPIRRFFFLKTEIAPSASSASTWAVLLFARLSWKTRTLQKECGTDRLRVRCCVWAVWAHVRVLRQEGALRPLCSKGQFSLEVANQSLSLREEGLGEVVLGWGQARFAQNTHCAGRSPQLLHTQCKYGQPHSSQDSLLQHTSKVQQWFSACSWNSTTFLQNTGV